MTEITVHIQTGKPKIDQEFFEHLNELAEQYGLHVEKKNDQEIDVQSQENIMSHKEGVRKQVLDEFIREADAFAKRVGPQTIDSADIIREERDNL